LPFSLCLLESVLLPDLIKSNAMMNRCCSIDDYWREGV
jgi:hypothetical protein